MLALLAGCASPGPPLPPSLKLPEIPTDLKATRVGDQVTLRWTTPARTTDKLLIKGPVTAEICLELPVAATVPVQSRGPVPLKTVTACAPAVVRESVTAGASEAMDALPVELVHGPARLLAYRVQLKNAAGRTAGPSAAVFAAAGAGPVPVEALRVTSTKDGVMLEWLRAPQPDAADAVELVRTTVEAPVAAASERMDALPGAGKAPAEERFRSGADGTPDAGGTLDRSAQMGATYRYTTERVRGVVLGGHALELRSVPSAAVTVAVRDVFPPEAPTGLVAVPGIEFTGAGEQSQIRTIDLSWDPNMEARLAGYRVYRRDPDRSAWQRLGTELLRVTAYQDRAVTAGQTYTYRVTAVSDAGIESGPSGEATETVPSQ